VDPGWIKAKSWNVRTAEILNQNWGNKPHYYFFREIGIGDRKIW
jgi:hypothetical protein